MITTLNQIRAKSPCPDEWKKLLAHLGKTQSDDDSLSIATIIDSNGLDGALWHLRAVEGKDKEIRLYSVWCARQVQHLMTDKRSLDALAVAERFANGEATREELDDARAAAWNASGDALTAWYAASDAARYDAAWVAWNAADVAWYAASGDASNASDASCYADSSDLRNVQESRLRELCQ